jgi:dihydrodipicolinate synthase/N-acetylneuraminate lyase
MASDPLPPSAVLARLRAGVVIPAHPLAITSRRALDERRQRALTRYYLAAGAGGVAVGVHTTQFAIREAGLLRAVLELAAEETRAEPTAIRIAGICGGTRQAVHEAMLARECGYHAGLLSLAALADADDEALLAHARAVAEVVPLFGFYLQPAVGGRVLPFRFWRRFAEIPNVVAIKIAPFDRYRTIDVVRAVAEAGRAGEIALYTGNDDSIVVDMLCEYRVGGARQRIVGGLLGHWAVWTKRAVGLLQEIHETAQPTAELLARAVEITDANAALFDAANAYRGSIAGLHEVLRRQGLLEGIWCLDPQERLSPGQAEEIDRVQCAYPHLNDDAFVAAHRDEWLR